MRLFRAYLTEIFVKQRLKELASAVCRLGGAMRALAHPKLQEELVDLEIIRDYIRRSQDRDALFHLSHRHYLSTRLGNPQRIECALNHYRYEGDNYDTVYKNAVYRDGGLVIWSKAVDGVVYAIKLLATTNPPQEGGTGVMLCADDVCLTEMSFVWIDGSLLGSEQRRLPFI